MNRYHIQTGLYAVSGIVGAVFFFYAFVGLISWVVGDPFGWIDMPSSVENQGVVKCRGLGGYPVKEKWGGGFLE